MGGVFHLNLEAVALEADLIEFDGLQHPTLVADKARRGVMYLEPGDDPHVFRGEITHQHTANGPVDDIHAADVTGADRHVVTLIMTCGIEPRQVVGIMTEVGIHFEDVVVVMLQCPSEPSDIGRTQSEFPAPFDDKETVTELCSHHIPDDGCRPVGGAVVDHENMETSFQGEYRSDNLLDILLLVVGRNDNYTVALVHHLMIDGAKIQIKIQIKRENGTNFTSFS